jgi:hypothetical protein
MARKWSSPPLPHGLDRRAFNLGQILEIAFGLLDRRQLARGRAQAAHPLQRPFARAYDLCLVAITFEMSWLVPHRIEARFIGKRVGAGGQVLGDQVERQMLLHGGPFLLRGARDGYEGCP